MRKRKSISGFGGVILITVCSSRNLSYSWSLLASIRKKHCDIDYQSSDFEVEVKEPQTVISTTKFDLASPREWMEWILETEGYNGAGAYTVIRCDPKGRLRPKNQWLIRGLPFHLDRLEKSFALLTLSSKDYANYDQRHIIDNALNESLAIINTLVNKAAQEDTLSDEVLMITLHWSRLAERFADGKIFKEKGRIRVRGHGRSMNIFDKTAISPSSINVSLALSFPSFQLDGSSNILQKVLPMRPVRYDRHPEAKISFWCRDRRIIEERCIMQDISEVILVRDHDTLLEGLTSNFFVLYNDNTLRTTSDGILQGYIRSRVMEIAKHSLGVEVVEQAPLLSEVGLWEVAFVTSSISLMKSVSMVFCPNAGDFDPIWCSENSTQGSAFLKLLHQELLNDEDGILIDLSIK